MVCSRFTLQPLRPSPVYTDGTELTLFSNLCLEAQRSRLVILTCTPKQLGSFSGWSYTTTMNLNTSALLLHTTTNNASQHQFKGLLHSQLLHLISLAASIGAPLKLDYLRVQSQDLVVQVVHFCHLRGKAGMCCGGDFQVFFFVFFKNNLPEQRQQLFPRSPARLSTSFQRLPTNTDMSLMPTHTTSAAVKIKQRKTGK